MQLDWPGEAIPAGGVHCPVCRGDRSVAWVRLSATWGDWQWVRCACGTLVEATGRAPDYSTLEGRGEFLLRLAQTDSPDGAIWPLLELPELAGYPLVDVGCGLGFAADFHRFLGAPALGVDPSPVARMAQQELGMPVVPGRLGEVPLPGSSPRVVLLSEVIEHVTDPRSILEAARIAAGNGGWVVVTTPNADVVAPDEDAAVVTAALGPAQHLFLLTEEGLAVLLAESGWEWSQTWTRRERLFAVAGPRPLERQEAASRASYRDYLEWRWAQRGEDPQALMSACFGYRLFKELVNAAEYDAAGVVWHAVAATYRERLGLDLEDPQEVVRLADSGALPWVPANVPMLLHMRAVLDINAHQDGLAAAASWRAAHHLAQSLVTGRLTGMQASDLETNGLLTSIPEALAVHAVPGAGVPGQLPGAPARPARRWRRP